MYVRRLCSLCVVDMCIVYYDIDKSSWSDLTVYIVVVSVAVKTMREKSLLAVVSHGASAHKSYEQGADKE